MQRTVLAAALALPLAAAAQTKWDMATPYADTPALLRDFKQVPRRELLAFDGGDPPQSAPCEARAAHGFLGLDADVVAAIATWIKATPRP